MIVESTYIYTLSCPESGLVRYVGKSNDPKKRFSRHINERVVTKKGSWIKSLVLNGLIPSVEIIDEIPMCDWEFWEKHYIKMFKSCGANLLNMNNGGNGATPIQITRDRQRLAKFGKKSPIPKKIKIRIKKERSRNPKSMIVSSYTLEGKKIKTFQTIAEASKDTNVADSVIGKICRKNPLYNKAKGFIFRFGEAEQITDITHRNAGKTKKAIVQYDLNNNFIAEFETIKSAAEKFNLHVPGISAVCRGVKKTAGGFIWKYKI